MIITENRMISLIVFHTILTAFLQASNVNAMYSLQPENKDIQKTCYKFDFGQGKVEPGYIQVVPEMNYSKERGFGFLNDDSVISSIDRGSDDALCSDFITGIKPFFFAVDVPEGDYNVTVYLGDKEGESVTTIKAESRRLMLENVHTAEGEFVTRVFTTNIRYSTINNNEEVKLTSRETGGHPNWDKKLTIEFNNVRPCICALEITRVEDAITVYLTGNSTVTDQQYEPWAAWGQMLPRFFKPGKISVANHAESGESLKSFIAENRLKKILSEIKPGDYMLIQFGHNDQKPQNSTYVKPFTGYKEYLKLFIGELRKHDAIPVLVTSMHRRKFDDTGKIINTHGDYPEAMRQAAREENVPLIDLHEMSRIFYEALGPEDSKKAFVHYPAGTFPGQNEEYKDNSHFNNYGAYQLARCVVEGIKANKLDIAKYLVNDIQPYDPAYPDPAEEWTLPVSPAINITKPDGS
ncbi:MAG: rhamnogalacturonan acetylesterase [Bacteroidales bacterium]|nr:MAG: rhamnogalacturonan acetylesterase [Bacteroidales bacterium]